MDGRAGLRFIEVAGSGPGMPGRCETSTPVKMREEFSGCLLSVNYCNVMTSGLR